MATATGRISASTAATAKPALPLAHTDYGALPGGKGGVSIELVFAGSRTTITAGPSAVTSYAASGIALPCKATGDFAVVGFPTTKLTLKHGSYGFSVHYRKTGVPVVTSKGSPSGTTSASITINGTVQSKDVIAGSVTGSAGSCRAGAVRYRATPLKGAS